MQCHRFRLYPTLLEVYQILYGEDCSILCLADRLFFGCQWLAIQRISFVFHVWRPFSSPAIANASCMTRRDRFLETCMWEMLVIFSYLWQGSSFMKSRCCLSYVISCDSETKYRKPYSRNLVCILHHWQSLHSQHVKFRTTYTNNMVDIRTFGNRVTLYLQNLQSWSRV